MNTEESPTSPKGLRHITMNTRGQADGLVMPHSLGLGEMIDDIRTRLEGVPPPETIVQLRSVLSHMS